jgi:hypothetical protein
MSRQDAWPLRTVTLASIALATALIVGALLVSGGGSSTHGLTFRDIAYGNGKFCTLKAQSNKVLLSKPKKSKASLDTLTLITKCNFKPPFAVKLSGVVTVHQKPVYKNYNTRTANVGRPRPGVPVKSKVKIPKAALTALKQGKTVSAVFFENVAGPTGREAEVNIKKLKGVKKK